MCTVPWWWETFTFVLILTYKLPISFQEPKANLLSPRPFWIVVSQLHTLQVFDAALHLSSSRTRWFRTLWVVIFSKCCFWVPIRTKGLSSDHNSRYVASQKNIISRELQYLLYVDVPRLSSRITVIFERLAILWYRVLVVPIGTMRNQYPYVSKAC